MFFTFRTTVLEFQSQGLHADDWQHSSQFSLSGPVSRTAVSQRLAFPEVAVAESHDSEGEADDFLVEKKHESSSQDRLQQFGFQAFKYSQHAVLSTQESK